MSKEEGGAYVRRASGLIREISGWDALMYNMASMGVLFVLIYTTWGLALYPGANLPLTALIAIPLGLPLAFTYALFSIAMPRSGGDYVWISRILHPALGFMINFSLVFVLLVAIGIEPSWALQYGIAPLLQSLSIVYGDPGLASLANTVSSPEFVTAVGLVYFILIGLALTRRPRTIMKIKWVLFTITILGALAYILGLLSAGTQTFISNFNSMSGMKYDEVIKAAVKEGYPSTFLWTATMLGIVYTFLNLIGYVFSSYIGGEVKEAQKSQLISMTGALVIFALLMFVVYQITFSVMGGEFIGGISYLAETGSKAYTLPFPEPFPHTLLVYATSNPVILALANIGVAVTPLLAGFAYIFLITRNIFAWAFDRVVPTSLSKVDERYGSPYVTTILVIILAMIFQALWLYTTVFQFVLYITTIIFIGYVVTGITAIIFPYKRKDIYEASPKIVRAKVGGIPVISILGLLTTIISAFVVYATLTPTLGGVMDPNALFLNMLVYPVALIIFAIAYVYRKKTGIPLEYSFKEVPPV